MQGVADAMDGGCGPRHSPGLSTGYSREAHDGDRTVDELFFRRVTSCIVEASRGVQENPQEKDIDAVFGRRYYPPRQSMHVLREAGYLDRFRKRLKRSFRLLT
jgi:hypothetical protein